MRNAWLLILALTGLTACSTPTPANDAAAPDGFIPLNDSGVLTDTGPARDTNPPIDGNVPPYDGGTPATCTGLTPVTPAGYCAALADAYVAEYTRCGLIGSAGATELRAAFLSGCDTSEIEASVTAGRSTWDAASAACCLAHSAMDTSCFLNPGAGPAECDFLQGTVANGGTCSSSVDCTNGYCHFSDTCAGTCTAYATTGTECDLGDVVCAPDATCDNRTHVCTTQTGTAGSACSDTAHTGCEPTLTCLDPDGDGNGTCTELPSRGERCDENTIVCDFNSGICDYDFATMTGICAPAFAIGSMRCIIDAQCAGDAYCRGASFGTMTYGTCTARATRGQSCATDKCVDGLVCRPDRTCGDQPALGDACTPASGCDGARCSGGGTCIALLGAGEHCAANNTCASRVCNPTTMTCAPVCP